MEVCVARATVGVGLGGMITGVAKGGREVGPEGMMAGVVVARDGRDVGLGGMGVGGVEPGRLQPAKSRTEMTNETKIE
jgi:hypothetical protein